MFNVLKNFSLIFELGFLDEVSDAANYVLIYMFHLFMDKSMKIFSETYINSVSTVRWFSVECVGLKSKKKQTLLFFADELLFALLSKMPSTV